MANYCAPTRRMLPLFGTAATATAAAEEVVAPRKRGVTEGSVLIPKSPLVATFHLNSSCQEFTQAALQQASIHSLSQPNSETNDVTLWKRQWSLHDYPHHHSAADHDGCKVSRDRRWPNCPGYDGCLWWTYEKMKSSVTKHFSALLIPLLLRQVPRCTSQSGWETEQCWIQR